MNTDSFERAKRNDVTVAIMLQDCQSLENIIGLLAHEKELYVQRIMELESIAPRKIMMPDGKVMLWQCPAEFVPPVSIKAIRETVDRPAQPAAPRFSMEQRTQLWNAINEYTEACGGTPYARIHGNTRRQQAVVAIEALVYPQNDG